jgi:hypothetical protein
MLIGEDLAEAHTRGGELVVGAVADTGATLEEWAVLPGKASEGGGGWIVGVGSVGLGQGRNGGCKAQGCEDKGEGACFHCAMRLPIGLARSFLITN